MAVVVATFVALGVAGYNQVVDFIHGFPDLLDGIIRLLERITTQSYSFALGPYSFDVGPVGNVNWDVVLGQLSEYLQTSWNMLLSRGGSVVGGVAQVTVSTFTALGTFFLILVMSIYITNDMLGFGSLVGDMAHVPGYREDAERLLRSFGHIWRAYLRGQIILALIMTFTVWIVLTILGVNNAFALGLLSGSMEFLPVIGAFIGAAVAILVAIFQPDNWLGLNFWQYGLLITAVMLVIQQIENNVLVPRIVGRALDLHPLVTLLAVFMGTTVAGILGAVLAAPVVATLKLLGMYAWRKMFDQPPFPEPEKRAEDEGPSLLMRAQQKLLTMRRKAVDASSQPPEA
jgi:predicted PurR-regulated permease PerM